MVTPQSMAIRYQRKASLTADSDAKSLYLDIADAYLEHGILPYCEDCIWPNCKQHGGEGIVFTCTRFMPKNGDKNGTTK